MTSRTDIVHTCIHRAFEFVRDGRHSLQLTSSVYSYEYKLYIPFHACLSSQCRY